MDAKKILLVESGNFIGGVIYSLLNGKEDLDVIEIEPQDVASLMKAVQHYQPETVVLEDSMQDSFLDTLLLHLRTSDGFQVVVVNTNSNEVEVYQKLHLKVKAFTDFLAVF